MIPRKANVTAGPKKVKISRTSNSTNAPTTRTLQGQGTEEAPAPANVTKKSYITEEDKNEIVNQILNNKTLAKSDDPTALKLQIAKM